MVFEVVWLFRVEVERLERLEVDAEDAGLEEALFGALDEVGVVTEVVGVVALLVTFDDACALGEGVGWLDGELIEGVVVLETRRTAPFTVELPEVELVELELEMALELEVEVELELEMRLELILLGLLPEPPGESPPDKPFPPLFKPLPPRPVELPVPVTLSSTSSVPSFT